MNTENPPLWQLLAPFGVLKFLDRKQAFEHVGLRGRPAWRAALSRSLRTMLVLSRLEFVPSAILRQAGVVVDVGANVGAWSEAVLTLVAPRQIIAVEPDPQAFAQLKARLGGRPNVRLVQVAVGAQNGQAPFHVMHNSQWSSLLPLRHADVREHYQGNDDVKVLREVQTVQVDVKRLDDLLRDVPAVSLLKVDIQGGEMALLDGARDTLARTQAVMLETNFVSHYEGDALFDTLHQRMTREFGFHLHRYARPTYGCEGGDGRLLYADAVYVNDAVRQD